VKLFGGSRLSSGQFVPEYHPTPSSTEISHSAGVSQALLSESEEGNASLIMMDEYRELTAIWGGYKLNIARRYEVIVIY